jgi:hypothetical protein
MTHHSVEWFNNSGLQGDCNLASALWAACQPPAMGLVTQRHSTMTMAECRVAGDKTQHAHAVEDVIGYS